MDAIITFEFIRWFHLLSFFTFYVYTYWQYWTVLWRLHTEAHRKPQRTHRRKSSALLWCRRRRCTAPLGCLGDWVLEKWEQCEVHSIKYESDEKNPSLMTAAKTILFMTILPLEGLRCLLSSHSVWTYILYSIQKIELLKDLLGDFILWSSTKHRRLMINKIETDHVSHVCQQWTY